MLALLVDVGVGAHRGRNLYSLFHHRETHQGDVFFLIVVIDMNPIVARQADAHALVGEGEGVMGVEHVGVEALAKGFDGLFARFTAQIVRLEESLVGGPVEVAGFHAVAIAPVLVREVVEGDFHAVAPPQMQQGRSVPLVAYHHSERAYMVGEHFMPLRPGCVQPDQGQQQGPDYLFRGRHHCGVYFT